MIMNPPGSKVRRLASPAPLWTHPSCEKFGASEINQIAGTWRRVKLATGEDRGPHVQRASTSGWHAGDGRVSACLTLRHFIADLKRGVAFDFGDGGE